MGIKTFKERWAIICGLLLLAAVLFGIHHLGRVISASHEARVSEEAVQVTPLGETMRLVYREIGQDCNYVPWDGTVEMKIQKATLYSSYTEAYEAGEDVGNPSYLLRDKSKPFLVVDVDVHNIDAEESARAWYEPDNIGTLEPDGAVTLRRDFRLYFDLPAEKINPSVFSCLWCVDGASTSNLAANATVAQGQTVRITLGFSLDNEMINDLGDASLIHATTYDRMSIGSPKLGGENDAVVS